MTKSRKFFTIVAVLVIALLMVMPGVASAAPASGVASAPSAASSSFWYQVRWGDTLAKIAARYGTTITCLQQFNGIANRNFIYAGQWLRIPATTTVGYPGNANRRYYYSSTYGCWGYSYYNWYYGRTIFICTN